MRAGLKLILAVLITILISVVGSLLFVGLVAVAQKITQDPFSFYGFIFAICFFIINAFIIYRAVKDTKDVIATTEKIYNNVEKTIDTKVAKPSKPQEKPRQKRQRKIKKEATETKEEK